MGLRTPSVTSITAIGFHPLEYGQTKFSVGCDFPKQNSTFPQFSEVNYDQMVEILKNKKATVIDVRNPDELKDYGSIPGAVNIPLKNLKVL